MNDVQYMRRCLALAALGLGHVAPNPLVGAVLVYNDKIIGEGYHMQYGAAHAEVNCMANVKDADRHLIPKATLYVSLEPCAHVGKTPPCADLIIRHNIQKVVIGTQDIFSKVNGAGITKLKAAGIDVVAGFCEEECKKINKRFFTYHALQRPFIILKWAQTQNNFIANTSGERLIISNNITNRLVHRWRAQEPAILIGNGTALTDNAALTVRLHKGAQPVRLLIDRHLKVPATANIYKPDSKTVVFNAIKSAYEKHIHFVKINFDQDALLGKLLQYCYDNSIQSLLVEGGAKTLQSFIDVGLWDECRIITNSVFINEGIKAPILKNACYIRSENIGADTLRYYYKIR